MAPSAWRLVVYGLVIFLGSLVALPSFLSPSQVASLPGWLPKNQVTLGLDLRGGAHLVLQLDENALHEELLDDSAIAERRRSALQQSIEIVRRRIDAMGVAEPTVQALGAGRILVQLPGVQDADAVRTLLGSTARLTFHRVHGSETRGAGTRTGASLRVQRR